MWGSNDAAPIVAPFAPLWVPLLLELAWAVDGDFVQVVERSAGIVERERVIDDLTVRTDMSDDARSNRVSKTCDLLLRRNHEAEQDTLAAFAVVHARLRR